MVHANNSGHPGGSLGCVEFLQYNFNHLNHNTKFNMDGIDEDLFFLSNGHISPVLYSVLARSDYFNVKELSTFRKIDSRLQGHPTTHEKLERELELHLDHWTRAFCCYWRSINKETK